MIARSAGFRKARAPAPSSESDRTKAEIDIEASVAAASTAANSSSERRMWATFTRLTTVLERNPFDAVIDRHPGACGRRPRIEGLSLDRQEKRITFFRILPSKLVIQIAVISALAFISYP